jgi:hypothetical protein
MEGRNYLLFHGPKGGPTALGISSTARVFGRSDPTAALTRPVKARRARRFSTPLDPPRRLKRCFQAIRARLERCSFLGSKMEGRAGASRWSGLGGRPKDRFPSLGAESAPSSCPLRGPRGRDPCNQADLAWCAGGLSRPLGALAAWDPFIQAIYAGARTFSFLGLKMEDYSAPDSLPRTRGRWVAPAGTAPMDRDPDPRASSAAPASFPAPGRASCPVLPVALRVWADEVS